MWLALALGAAAFCALAIYVHGGPPGEWDKAILLALRRPHDHALMIGPSWMVLSVPDITALGGFTVLTLIWLMGGALLALHGRGREALVFMLAVAAAQALSETLKILIDRPRPTVVPHLGLATSLSFPSGHAMMSSAVYLTLATILASGTKFPGVKILLLGFAALLVFAVGFSRLFLGVHWPSDVLAGWILGGEIALIAAVVSRRPGSGTGRRRL